MSSGGQFAVSPDNLRRLLAWLAFLLSAFLTTLAAITASRADPIVA